MSGVLAIAVTHAELSLLLRTMRDYAERHDSPIADDVVAMLENAIEERDRAWLGMSPMVEAPAEREVAS